MGIFKRRRDKRAKNQLGVIKVSENDNKIKKFRRQQLETYDKYYEDRAYNHLWDWHEALTLSGDDYIPIRQRKPYIRYNLTKVFSSRVAAKLVGRKVFPRITVEEDPDTEFYLGLIIKASKMQLALVNGFRKMAASGSVLIRYSIQGGAIKMEHYNPNHCYPKFLPNGELESVEIKYTYFDMDDRDERGNPKEKWFRMDLGTMQDILYDNPEYKKDDEPIFKVVSAVAHNLGFVQGEWFRTAEDKFSPDGYSFADDIIPFNDEMNYSLSQSSQTVGYNQDPQLTMKGMDEDEIDKLIRSSQKGWNLGRDGDAGFLETSMQGVERAIELRDKVRLAVQDVTRVILLDPEKMATHAQSGKAMETLHGPFVELVDELRQQVEPGMIRLLSKVALTNIIMARSGAQAPINIPPGYQPKSLNIGLDWPPVFPMTVQDLTERVRWVTSATAANLISRETGTKVLAKDFGVENIEEEILKLENQPVINPFGMF